MQETTYNPDFKLRPKSYYGSNHNDLYVAAMDFGRRSFTCWNVGAVGFRDATSSFTPKGVTECLSWHTVIAVLYHNNSQLLCNEKYENFSNSTDRHMNGFINANWRHTNRNKDSTMGYVHHPKPNHHTVRNPYVPDAQENHQYYADKISEELKKAQNNRVRPHNRAYAVKIAELRLTQYKSFTEAFGLTPQGVVQKAYDEVVAYTTTADYHRVVARNALEGRG